MYHIKEDPRAFKSSELLYQGLVTCMNEKDFNKITVTDIANASTVGRATFYRNFDEIIDILEWKCHEHFAKVVQDYVIQDPNSDNKVGFLFHVFSYWMKNVDVLELLFSIDRIDIIYKCFSENALSITHHLQQEDPIPKEQHSYFISLRISTFIGIMRTWIINGKKETAKELTQMIIEHIKIANTLITTI